MNDVRPLLGVKVVDFSRVLAGPMATQVLADLGAEVVKIENPAGGDESRRMEPLLPGGESAYFLAFNRGKKSVALNLKSPEGQRLAREIVRTADVLVENFLPGTMEEFGLGYDDLSALNPGLVYVSNTGFGQKGPYANRKGYDTIFQALSGIMALTGHPESPPVKSGVPIADMASSLWIVIAALAGLLGRVPGGKGAHIDVAMMDVQISLLGVAAAGYFATGVEPERVGSQHPGRVPSASFECSDGRWLHISCSDQHWRPLCDVLGLDDLAADEALSTNAGRVHRREHVMGRIAAVLSELDRNTLAERLREADVPVGEVNSLGEILGDVNTQERGMVSSFHHPLEGDFPAIDSPLHGVWEGGGVTSPPLLGADTEGVLSELGLDDAEIEKLRGSGVVR